MAHIYARQDRQDSRDLFLYVDEFHNLPRENFGELLSEARKYRLGLILATQYADQLKGPTRQSADLLPAVLGNVGTIVMFRVGIKDAEKIAAVFHPVFDKNDLADLPNWHAYARFQVDGTSLPAFSFLSQKDTTAYDGTLASRIRELSRAKYGMDVEMVDAQIARRRSLWRESASPEPFSKTHKRS